MAKTVATWGITALLAALYLFSGGSKLIGGVATPAEHFGYPVALMYFIGVCEVLGAVGLLLPRLATLAACGLAVIMVGAVWSHVSVGDPFTNVAVPAAAAGLLVTLALLRRSDMVGPAPTQAPTG